MHADEQAEEDAAHAAAEAEAAAQLAEAREKAIADGTYNPADFGDLDEDANNAAAGDGMDGSDPYHNVDEEEDLYNDFGEYGEGGQFYAREGRKASMVATQKSAFDFSAIQVSGCDQWLLC